MIRDFWEEHPDSEQQLKLWFKEVSDAKWNNQGELKIKFPFASIINGNRVVFNIRGNHKS